MGPRQDAGEDMISVDPWLTPLRSFNGAPAGCRGRHGFTLVRGKISELQWGPGRMPGKTGGDVLVFRLLFLLQWGPGRMPGKTRGLWKCNHA